MNEELLDKLLEIFIRQTILKELKKYIGTKKPTEQVINEINVTIYDNFITKSKIYSKKLIEDINTLIDKQSLLKQEEL